MDYISEYTLLLYIRGNVETCRIGTSCCACHFLYSAQLTLNPLIFPVTDIVKLRLISFDQKWGTKICMIDVIDK